MKRFFKIYKECIHASVTSAAAYRADFILSNIITLLYNILLPLVTILIYGAGRSFPGWGFYEVLLIQSIFTLSNGFTSMTVSGILYMTMGRVKSGDYEIILLKPMDPLLYLVFTSFSLSSLGLIIGGIALFTVAVVHTGIAGFLQVLEFIVLFLSGTAVMSGLWLLMAALSFQWVGNSRLSEIFDSLQEFGKYPLGIFPKIVQGLATFLIPVGMIGFYPASALLGRTEPVILWFIIPAILFLLLGIFLYHYMIRLYKGVGG